MKNKTLGAIVAGTFIALASPAVVSADEDLTGTSKDDCGTKKDQSDIYNNNSTEMKFTEQIKTAPAKKKVRKRRRRARHLGEDPLCGRNQKVNLRKGPRKDEEIDMSGYECVPKTVAKSRKDSLPGSLYTLNAKWQCPRHQVCATKEQPQKELVTITKETTKEVKVPVLADDPLNAYKKVLEGMDREKCKTPYDGLASKVLALETLRGKKGKESEDQRKLLSKAADLYVKSIDMEKCGTSKTKVIEVTQPVAIPGPQGPKGDKGDKGDTVEVTKPETKPRTVIIEKTPEQEAVKNWKLSAIAGVLSGAAKETNGLIGAELQYNPVAGLVFQIRGGYLSTDDKHGEETSQTTSENKLLPDGTTYKNTIEETSTLTSDSQNNGFVGGSLGYSWELGEKVRLTLNSGADARIRKQETNESYQKNIQLERNGQDLGQPKTISKQETSSKTTVEPYVHAGLELCLGNEVNFCFGYEGGYDFGTDRANHGGMLKLGFSW